MKNKVGKKILLSVVFILSIMLVTGCKGSKDVQGKWYAVNSDNTKLMINITEKKITFSGDSIKKVTVDYKQNGTGFKNNVSYKVLKFDDKEYSFVFPKKKDKDNALIITPDKSDDKTSGSIVWSLSRKDYPDYPKNGVSY